MQLTDIITVTFFWNFSGLRDDLSKNAMHRYNYCYFLSDFSGLSDDVSKNAAHSYI